MTSIIKLTCLSGAVDRSPPCYLLQIDQFNCLLDCGWVSRSTPNIFNEQIIRNLDAVLLTYPDAFHLGALPYLVGRCGLTCPIYATRPVNLMGRMFMTDLLLSRLFGEEFDLFNQADIDNAFDKITHLSYNQSFQLSDKGHGLTIIPLRAGHMIGGTIWKIIKDNEEDILYAVDFNHTKEQHLDRCVLDVISRPSLLITDASNATYSQKKMSKRDDDLKRSIQEGLRGGGNVLIACDTAGRVLELAYILDCFWRKQDNGLSAYSLALVSNVANNMIDITKSTIEWMSANILRSFEDKRDNPFRFKHLQLKQNLRDLAQLPHWPEHPIVVLATQPDLDCGFARDLFTLWCTDARNTIIFTERSSPGTLAHEVLGLNQLPTRKIEVELRQRIELQGAELVEYKTREDEKKQLALAVINKDQLSESESSEDEHDVEIGVGSAKKKHLRSVVASQTQSNPHDLMMKDGRMKGVTFFKQARKTHPMFPVPAEQRRKWDDYGEIINPDDYVLFSAITEKGDKQLESDDKENQNHKDEEATKSIESEEKKPTKCVAVCAPLEIKAKVLLFDYEGRADGESVKNIINKIRPRRLILVRGTEEGSRKLKKLCEANVSDRISIPQEIGVPVDVTTENHIYQVKLKDSLVSSIDFVRAENGVELAWIEAEIEPSEEKSLLPAVEDGNNKTSNDAKTTQPASNLASAPQLVRGAEGTNVPANASIKPLGTVGDELLPSLEALPPDQLPLHRAIFVNELKLSDFKQILMNNNIQAEFSGGVLYCNDKVAIRRRETGKIHLEGTLCPDYYKIRQLLYNQYVVF